MSKFIPMVSASPPPLDEKEFEWEEEDDDFGKFAGGDDSVVDVDWSDKTCDNNDSNGRQTMDCDNEQGEIFDENSTIVTKMHIVSKPHVQKLSFLIDNHITDDKHSLQDDGKICIENNDSSSGQTEQQGSLKRDSDSGMFSTDISPIPVSEDGTIELEATCDNSVNEETNEMIKLPSTSNISTEKAGGNQAFKTSDTLPSVKPSSASTNIMETNPIPKHTTILHDSDEEFDQHSSNILDSLSNQSTESVIESSCMSEEINDDCDFSNDHEVQENIVINVSSQKNISLGVENAEKNDEFGDFADFSSQNNNRENGDTDCAFLKCSVSSSPKKILESKDMLITKSQDESCNYFKTHDVNHDLENRNDDGCIFDNLTNFQDSNTENVSYNRADKVTNDTVKIELTNSEQPAQKVESNDDRNDVLSQPSNKTGKDLSFDGEKRVIDGCSVISKTEDSSDKIINSDEDEFADFSCASFSEQTGDNNEDFADFSSVPFNSHTYTSIDGVENYFANFSSITLPSKSSEASSQYSARSTKDSDDENSIDDEDFSDFSSVKHACKENDDWAAFSKAEEHKSLMSHSTHSVTGLKALDVQKLQTVIEASFMFDLNSSHTTENVSLLDTILMGSTYPQSTEYNGREYSVRKVMKQVYDYDNTNALIYQWKKSQSNDRLFKTLNIDTKNMFFGLKKEVVPLSLTSLTLLEPIRGAIPGKKDKTTEALVEPNMDSLPQVQDIPPVEFDWDNSGLTNPLEAKTLDLDFMVVQENENSIKTGVFQSEILDAPRSSVKPMQPLEDILKTMKLTTTTAPSGNKKDANLSKEAESIIESLPLLSFMKSKVLMFRLQNS